MSHFHIKSILAFCALGAVTWLAYAMLSQPELANKTEIGILLGVIASVCGICFKYLFEDHSDKGKDDGTH